MLTATLCGAYLTTCSMRSPGFATELSENDRRAVEYARLFIELIEWNLPCWERKNSEIIANMNSLSTRRDRRADSAFRPECK